MKTGRRFGVLAKGTSDAGLVRMSPRRIRNLKNELRALTFLRIEMWVAASFSARSIIHALMSEGVHWRGSKQSVFPPVMNDANCRRSMEYDETV